MSQVKAIRRGSAPKRRASVSRGPARRGPRQPISARLAAVLPFPEAAIRRTGHFALLALFACAIGTAALMIRLPQMIAWQLGEGVGRLGFTMERVEIQGMDPMTPLPEYVDRLPIYAIAFDQPSNAMPNIDLTDTRARVEALGWVREARVWRRLADDTLVVAVAERVPAAIWQHEQRLYLIDNEGAVLDRVALDAMPDLPLIIGPGANRQAAAFAALIDAAPALRPMLDGATWVGERRWDLRFQSGETLALPEGEEDAARALVRFARMDGVTGMLGEGFLRFDMRLPDRFVVRISRERTRRERLDAGENI